MPIVDVDCLFVQFSGLQLGDEQQKLDAVVFDRKINLENPFSETIAYLGTYLQRRGISFDYVSSFVDEKDLLIQKLKKDIKAVAISTTFCQSIDTVNEMVKFVKINNPSVKVIVGGPFIVSVLQQVGESERQILLRRVGADFYIDSYKGEYPLVDIIYAIKNCLSFEQIVNIYYKQGGKYIITKRIAEESNLEDNMVDWKLFADRVGKCVSVRTSISCPFSCAYCAFPQNAGKYATVSIQAIERELNSIEQTGKVKIIGFIDDTFNVPPNRFKEILRMMVNNKYDFKWYSYFRCQYADEETVELMKKSGCNGVFLGFESGNQEMLNRMNKSVTIEELKKGHTLLKNYEITTIGLFFIGFPGETTNTVKDTVNFIEEIQPIFYSVQPWFCDVSTPVWIEKEKLKINGFGYKWAHETMDFNTAVESINEMRLIIKNSTELRLGDYAYILQLIDEGMNIQKVKEINSRINAVNIYR